MTDEFRLEPPSCIDAAARRRNPNTPCGYAAAPGTGPAGETCRTCMHAVGLRYGRTYWKCAKVRHKWTGGRRTDIRLKSPACSAWEARSDG